MIQTQYKTDTNSIHKEKQQVKAVLLITVDYGYTDTVFHELNNFSEINQLYQVRGPYDLIAYIEVDNINKLQDTVQKKVKKIDRVKRTYLLMRTPKNAPPFLDTKPSQF